MKLLTTLVKRIIVSGGGNCFCASVINAGLSFANRFTLVASTATPALAIDITRHEFRGPTQAPGIDTGLLGATGTAANEIHTPAVDIDASIRAVAATNTQQLPALVVAQKDDIAWTTPTQAPAVDIDLIGATGTAANQVHTPALDIDASLRDAPAANVSQVPACNIVQITYDLTRVDGASATANFDTAWTNPGNAVGLNGVGGNATCVGSVLGNTNGIELSYLNHVLKGELTIISATLNVYMNVVDATGLLCDTNLSYNIGAGFVALEPTIQGAFTNLITPRSYSLPLLSTWDEYDALQFRAQCIFAAVSALSNAALDAVTITIVATLTEVNPP